MTLFRIKSKMISVICSVITVKTCFSRAFWLLLYLHTKIYGGLHSNSRPLVSPLPSSWEGVGYTQSVWVPGTWPEVYFLTRLVMGTEAAVQIQGSHRLTKKHRGQGLTKPRGPWCKRSHTADELHALLAGNGRWSERRGGGRERQAPPVRGIPVKVVSHPRRVYRDHRCVLLCVKRLPVPTVEHLSTELEPSSRSGPEDRRACARVRAQKVPLLSKSRDDTINSGSHVLETLLQNKCEIKWNDVKKKKNKFHLCFSQSLAYRKTNRRQFFKYSQLYLAKYSTTKCLESRDGYFNVFGPKTVS